MNRVTVLDGAVGTMLQREGLPFGARPELFGLEHPDILERVHRAYVDAGSDVIYANTFGANARKLRGCGHSVAEVAEANVAAAKRAAKARPRKCGAIPSAKSRGDTIRVAMDAGPIGELTEPLGTLSFDEAYEIYREMAQAGERAGADLIVFETMSDLAEARAAVLAARENTGLPVWVTMSFEADGRTFSGTLVSSMAATLDGLGVDAMGINCSLGPEEILPLIQKMREWTDRPLIAKPNAGLPDPATGEYPMGAGEFLRQMRPFFGMGISVVGGCCGTTPEFIAGLRALADETREAAAVSDVSRRRRGVCSSGKMVEFGGVRVVGERINPTGKRRFAQALRERDMNRVMQRAAEQADAGADILDINVGLPGLDEPALMADVVRSVQGVVSLPLQIDSSDPAAIEAGLRACNGRAVVNSVDAQDETLGRILPIVKKYGAAVVGLTMDQSGIPKSARERFSLAEKIADAAAAAGIPREDVLIDCLTLTVSAQQEQAAETLRAVRMVHERLGLHCVLGVSNISFGLPKRIRVTTSFLTQAMQCGLDFPIVNPNRAEIMDAIAAFRALSGEDAQCEAYIARFADARDEGEIPAAPAQMSVGEAISKGLKEETRALTAKLLEGAGELDVINKSLIPALDAVGERYERQEIFLPQLINSANAACAGFDLIRERIAKRGGENVSRGVIVMATVEGDIHDIGKNIVRVILENYGYRVIDLGRDVPAKKVVDTVIAQDARLVGLSALMTTTVASMKKTIAAIRASGHDCRVMAGGAVLTPDYADEIGADYYVRDAKASVDVAKEVLG